MAMIQLALHCLTESKCCSMEEADRIGKLLVAGITSPRLSQTPPDTQTATECWASSEGERGLRSVSPWRYRLDWEPNRYPEYLLQAYCSCSHCVSLSKQSNSPRIYTRLEVKGNSVPIEFHTLVFYRKSCSADGYYLEPKSIPVNVSCACLAARHDR
ncbi:interleukin-25 [Tiliqua scincoides]|uniref:interleukin-25 n=1 Tax=Tiliqua scincoides TaxID=71010 RepID=UPI003461E7A6